MMKHKQKVAHWQKVFSQQSKSGTSTADFCKQQKVSPSIFYAWRKRMANDSVSKPSTTVKQQLVPLFLEHNPIEQVSSLTLTTPQGYQLVFEDTLAPNKLRKILATPT